MAKAHSKKLPIMTESFGGVVVNPVGEFLLVGHNKGGAVTFPKGHKEKGECGLEAAVREVYEETGITDLVYISDLGKYSRFRIAENGKDYDISELKTIHLILFESGDKSPSSNDPENINPRWVKKESVGETLTDKKDREFFYKILPKIERHLNL